MFTNLGKAQISTLLLGTHKNFPENTTKDKTASNIILIVWETNNDNDKNLLNSTLSCSLFSFPHGGGGEQVVTLPTPLLSPAKIVGND